MNENVNLEEETTTESTVTDVDEEEIPEVSAEDLFSKLADLKKRADSEAKRADEMTNVATRLRTDFDNYRKRTNENAAKVKDDGRIEVLEKIIPVLDVIEQAIAMMQEQSVKDGLLMIKNQLNGLLDGFGIKEIDASGEFNPKLHEAIMMVPSETDEQKGKIKEVFQKGYALGDRIIRASRVIVYND